MKRLYLNWSLLLIGLASLTMGQSLSIGRIGPRELAIGAYILSIAANGSALWAFIRGGYRAQREHAESNGAGQPSRSGRQGTASKRPPAALTTALIAVAVGGNGVFLVAIHVAPSAIAGILLAMGIAAGAVGVAVGAYGLTRSIVAT